MVCSDSLIMSEKVSPSNPFNGKHLQVYIEDSRYGPYEIVRTSSGHGVGVIAVSGRDVLLVQQERPAVRKTLWEFPGGAADNGDEALAEDAARELSEEANVFVNPEDLVPVESYHGMSSMCDIESHKFFVRLPDDFDRSVVKFQDSELQGIGWFDIETLFDGFKNGDMQFSGIVGGLLKAQLLGLI
jgi:8-oxo-dGTP pyrophosphatase MutT (NUDIX family)